MKFGLKTFNIMVYSLLAVLMCFVMLADFMHNVIVAEISLFILFIIFFIFIQKTILAPINSITDFAAGKRGDTDKSMFYEINLLAGRVYSAVSELNSRNAKTNLLLKKFFNNMHDGVLIHDMHGNIIDVNDTVLRMYAASNKEDMLHLTIPDISTQNNPIDKLDEIWKNVLGGVESRFEWEVKKLDGKTFWAEVYLTKIELESDVYILANIRDISEIKRQNTLIASIMDLQESMVFLSSDERIMICNNRFMEYFSFHDIQNANEHFHCIKGLFLDAELECKQPLCKFGRSMRKEHNKLICEHKDGQREIFLVSVNDLFFEEELYIVSLTDITSMELEKEILELKSSTDHLTSLKNRGYFDKTIQLEITKARQSGDNVSVIMFDIDKFKDINDMFGHQAGDDTLKFLADLVVKNTRKHDTVARYGGEEFIIIAPNIGLTSATELAEKIRRIIDESRFDGVPRFTCSFGVATWNREESETELLKRVDGALYAAKETGRNKVVAV